MKFPPVIIITQLSLKNLKPTSSDCHSGLDPESISYGKWFYKGTLKRVQNDEILTVKEKMKNYWNHFVKFLTTYISVKHLFGVPRDMIFLYVLLAVSGVLFFFSLAVKFILPRKFKDKVYKKYLQFFFKWSMVLSVFGFFFAFFSYEGTIYLGYRIWIYCWIIVIISWIIYSIVKVRANIAKDLENHKKKKEKEKWMRK